MNDRVRGPIWHGVLGSFLGAVGCFFATALTMGLMEQVFGANYGPINNDTTFGLALASFLFGAVFAYPSSRKLGPIKGACVPIVLLSVMVAVWGIVSMFR